jgi:hypothetical protein
MNHATTGFGLVRGCLVTTLAPTGFSLAYSTFLRGCQHDWGEAIAVDKGAMRT